MERETETLTPFLQRLQTIEAESRKNSVEKRPKNTNKQYNPKILEFQRYCEEKNVDFIISPQLALAFLEDKVYRRKKKNRKRNRYGEEDEIVGKSTLKAYVAALRDLWVSQKAEGINPHDHPRSPQVVALLEQSERDQVSVDRENCRDRGIGTLLDGYSSLGELRRLASECMNPTSALVGRWRLHKRIRTRTACLLSHAGVLRSEDIRGAELADLFSLPYNPTSSESSPIVALVLTLLQGKTNAKGNIEIASCFRFKDPNICPIGALGFYLFLRWRVEGEPFPCFNTNDWYTIKILRGETKSNSKTEISYDSIHSPVKELLSVLGIPSSHTTHIFRIAAARMAELAGAPEMVIRRLGRWLQSALESSYLKGLPVQGMLILAGWGSDSRNYLLDCSPANLN